MMAGRWAVDRVRHSSTYRCKNSIAESVEFRIAGSVSDALDYMSIVNISYPGYLFSISEIIYNMLDGKTQKPFRVKQ